WRRSLSCAFFCQKLAPLRNLDAEEAFLAGLLHGFGRSVVVGCLERVLSKQQVTESRTLIDWLKAVEPHRHQLAQRVAEQWKLPAELVAVCGGSDNDDGIAELVDLADRLAETLDRGGTAEQLLETRGIAAGERRAVSDLVLALPPLLEALVEAPNTN